MNFMYFINVIYFKDEIRSAIVFMVFRFTRKLLVAVVDGWDSRVLKIEKVIPPTWKVV